MDESLQEDEDHAFGSRKDALALRLQQRRSRKVLADQGIMSPIKSPASFFGQVQKLEWARTKDNLNRSIQSRPERDKLVQMHILEDTPASNALVANQKDLKKAQLVDDLNDKIAFRPGVIELVERNIIPANEPLHEALKGGHIQYKKIADLVDEDSSEALSPEQAPPPPTSSPPLVLHITSTLPTQLTTSIADRQSAIKNDSICLMKSPSSSSLYSQNSSHPYLSRQLSKGSKLVQGGIIPRITPSRKKKEKPKFKKFKYHQYIPPDQHHGKSRELNAKELGGDTPYSRLLQQQQLYLQLQIMNKQYSTQLSNHRSEHSQQTGSFSQSTLGAPSPPPLSQSMKEKPSNICATLTMNKLDEMKVSELKEELKYRRLKVTGTKEVLVDRLKPFCVDYDNPFLTDPLNHDENSSSSFPTAGSPTAMSEGSSYSAHDKDNGAGGPVFPPLNNQQQQHGSAPFASRVARMPIPEQHKIVLKQEKFTMPTWHSNIQDARVVSMVTTHPTSSIYTASSRKLTKDKLLEEQQKEIQDLRKMVELHRSQLQQLQDHKQLIKKKSAEKLLEAQQAKQSTFEFPTATQNAQPAVQFCSGNPTTNRQTSSSSQPYNSPPNYEQAFELMNDDDPRPNHHHHERANQDMDALLELLADNGELPSTPVVARLNNHNPHQHNHQHQVAYTTRLNDVPNHNQHVYTHNQHPLLATYQQQQQQAEYGSVIAQERAQLQQDIAHHHQQQQQQQQQQQRSCSHRGSRDFASPDLTKMLVETAGDALMDTSNFPPVISPQERGAGPGGIPNAVGGYDQPLNYSRQSARNSVDSGIIYANSHYSPMDTNLDGSSKDIFNDLRLSSSSLDSGEPTLNTISLSPATPPRPRPHLQSTFRPHPSPRSNQLIKSASQELLSTSDGAAPGNHPMDNELGWLDLTLSAAVAGPGTPGGPFGQINFAEEPHMQRFHSAMPYQSGGYSDYEPGAMGGAGGSTGTLNINHGMSSAELYEIDLLDALGASYNT